MKGLKDREEIKSNSNRDTNSVTPIMLITHCIVCGSAFPFARMGKLYCSQRCKQFGYNHKHKISQAIANRERGINPKPLSFYSDDYTAYHQTQKLLKRYRELEKKRLSWEEANQELLLKQKYDLTASNYLSDQFTRKKLTDDDEGELYDAERILPEDIPCLNFKELSLEQWSFIKSLHPNFDNFVFFDISASLSDNLIKQLSLNKNSSDNSSDESIIKNKFTNHCNLISIDSEHPDI